jgi:general secretion pathway protein J
MTRAPLSADRSCPGPRGTRASSNAQAGFTLAEVLVSLAILGLVLVLLFSNVRFGTRAWHAAELHSDRASELQTVSDLMRRQLAQAYPFYDSEQSRIEFEGGPNSIRFKAPLPAHLALGGLYDIGYSVVADAEGRRLVMARALHRPGVDGRTRAVEDLPTTLIDGVEGIEIAYFGSAGGDHEPQWLRQWPNMTNLPSLIRIRVHFPPDDARVWPDLIVKVAVDLDANCIYDPRQRRCRNRQ